MAERGPSDLFLSDDPPPRRGRPRWVDGLGLAVDPERNAVRSGEARLISPDSARVAVAVVPTDEELEIATQTYALVAGNGQ